MCLPISFLRCYTITGAVITLVAGLALLGSTCPFNLSLDLRVRALRHLDQRHLVDQKRHHHRSPPDRRADHHHVDCRHVWNQEGQAGIHLCVYGAGGGVLSGHGRHGGVCYGGAQRDAAGEV
jgi:hypothetical protein